MLVRAEFKAPAPLELCSVELIGAPELQLGAGIVSPGQQAMAQVSAAFQETSMSSMALPARDMSAMWAGHVHPDTVARPSHHTALQCSFEVGLLSCAPMPCLLGTSGYAVDTLGGPMTCPL